MQSSLTLMSLRSQYQSILSQQGTIKFWTLQKHRILYQHASQVVVLLPTAHQVPQSQRMHHYRRPPCQRRQRQCRTLSVSSRSRTLSKPLLQLYSRLPCQQMRRRTPSASSRHLAMNSEFLLHHLRGHLPGLQPHHGLHQDLQDHFHGSKVKVSPRRPYL